MAEAERRELRYSPEKQSDEQAVTSPPELNPMMNPVLGRNLGRWAEVYFTTPAEQREQAVLELLRELESGEPDHPEPIEAPRESSALPVEGYTSDPAAEQVSEQSNATRDHIAAIEEAVRLFEKPGSRVAVAPLTSRSCPVCQHDNRPEQVYCGMCGYRLNDAAAAAAEPVVERSISIEHTEMDEQGTEPAFPTFGSQLPYAREPEYVGMVDRDPLWPLHVEEEGRGWGSVFKFIAVVVLAGAAWLFLHQRRTTTPVASTSTTSSTQASTPFSGPTATEPAATSPEAAPAAQSIPPQAPSTLDGSRPASSASTSIEEQKSADLSKNSTERAAPVTQSPDLTQSPDKETPPNHAGLPVASQTASNAPAALPRAPTSIDGGTEELDRARDLLAGKSSAPDAGQASVWLWKAVSKHNLPAVLLLADLYARGEGVPRSCDQARVLLSAALKRGSVEATQRLQELQRSGCSGR